MRVVNVPAAILAVLLAAAALAGCAGGPSAAAAHTAGSPGEFARFGLSPSRIEAWEDGARTRFVDLLTGFTRLAARLARFDGAYLRFSGTVTLERFENGRVAETVSQDTAVWELMYFGHAPR